MIRLFVALELPLSLRQDLSLMAGGIPGARWIAAENLHLTLRFIGDVDEDVGEAAAEALSTVRGHPFVLRLQGLGTFGHGKRVNALWEGVERSDPLYHLQEKIESALVRAGLASEGRKFQPHVTVARFARAFSLSRLEDFIAGNNLFSAELKVDRFTLFSSRRGGEAPVYVPEASYPLV